MKIKFGIDATFTLHGGSHGHLIEFIKNISRTYSKSDLILYLKKENLIILDKDVLNKCSIKIIKSVSLGNIFRLIWCQFFLPIIVKIDKVDVLFCPGNFSPIFKTTKIKAQWIATIGPFCKDMYDDISLFSKLSLILNKFIILLSGYTSNVVVHQAEYSKKLFEKEYGFNSSKQFLIQCGKDDFYHPNKKFIKSSNKILNITSKDFLYVSHIFPYKNIVRLINAFTIYKKEYISNVKLYIVGKIMDTAYFNKLKNLIYKNDLSSEIIFTGPAIKNELRLAYSSCKLFIFPSLCESSGYSLIEAMSCGAPILASNKTAIPDTCRDAAEYFDGYDEKDLLIKLTNISKNNSRLQLMKSNSLRRSSEMIDYEISTNIFLDIVKSKLSK